jgi:uncharacterized membrane protein SpoIIM required for sporulation
MTRDDWIFLFIGMGFLFVVLNVGGEAVIELPGLKIAANAGIAIILAVLFIFFYRMKKKKSA